MLPLTLLRAAQGQEILVELKNGETYNGHLVNIDTWMNLNLRNVTRTGKDGDRFWRVAELYVRGNTVKYMRVPDKVIDIAEDNARNAGNRNRSGGRGRGRGGGRGGRGGRGAGRGGRGRNSRDSRDGRPYQNQHIRYDSD